MGRNRLLPFGSQNPKQETLDCLFKPYIDSGKAIESATVLRVGEHELFDDLNDSEREEAFALSELIALSGLAAREFFGIGMFYCNKDNFTCIIQGFDSTHAGAAISTRRRDGQGLNFVSAKTYKVLKPHHISGFLRVRIDIPLLNALVAARNQPWWDQFFEAIFWFNRANTDSDSVIPQIEAVETIGAFERLLGLHNGSEKELRQELSSCFIPTKEMPRENSERSKRFKSCRTVREAWITDFFRLRGDHSHGRRKARYISAWSLKEHLLLGAFLFPLLTKIKLSKASLYTLSRRDRAGLGAFEVLASADLFERQMDNATSQDWPWNRVFADVLFRTMP